MIRLIANNQTMQANTVHLYVTGQPLMDMERQKLGIFRENSPKTGEKLGILRRLKKVGILGILGP